MTNVNCRLENLVKTEKESGSRSNKRHIEIELKFWQKNLQPGLERSNESAHRHSS